MMFHKLFRHFCLAMTAAAFAEAGEHETARTLLDNPSRSVRQGRLPLLEKAYAG